MELPTMGKLKEDMRAILRPRNENLETVVTVRPSKVWRDAEQKWYLVEEYRKRFPVIYLNNRE